MTCNPASEDLDGHWWEYWWPNPDGTQSRRCQACDRTETTAVVAVQRVSAPESVCMCYHGHDGECD